MTAMINITKLIQAANHSRWRRWLANLALWQIVPFNKPHQISITEVLPHGIVVKAPYQKVNQNHIGGMHACLLATLCEYVSGLVLLSQIPSDHYRIILKSIQMDYHYQAKKDVTARFEISEEEVRSLLAELARTEQILQTFQVKIYDVANHHICTGTIQWQIKNWSAVRTKV